MSKKWYENFRRTMSEMSESSNQSPLRGDVFLLAEDDRAFASAQIDLLLAIEKCGSISKAAKHVGISYKTAWDRIDAINNMSTKPLVHRSAGGAHGGGTSLTELGKQICVGFQLMQEEHRQFIEHLGNKVQSLADVAAFMKSEKMKSSARNQFRGRISRITPGAVNAEVELDIGAEQTLIAIITQDSVENLGLRIGADVIALIKASSVIVSTDLALRSSARNKLVGIVSRVVAGAVNTDVSIDIGAGKTVCAMVTNVSAVELALTEGLKACALFKASSVILLQDR